MASIPQRSDEPLGPHLAAEGLEALGLPNEVQLARPLEVADHRGGAHLEIGEPPKRNRERGTDGGRELIRVVETRLGVETEVLRWHPGHSVVGEPTTTPVDLDEAVDRDVTQLGEVVRGDHPLVGVDAEGEDFRRGGDLRVGNLASEESQDDDENEILHGTSPFVGVVASLPESKITSSSTLRVL